MLYHSDRLFRTGRATLLRQKNWSEPTLEKKKLSYIYGVIDTIAVAIIDSARGTQGTTIFFLQRQKCAITNLTSCHAQLLKNAWINTAHPEDIFLSFLQLVLQKILQAAISNFEQTLDNEEVFKLYCQCQEFLLLFAKCHNNSNRPILIKGIGNCLINQAPHLSSLNNDLQSTYSRVLSNQNAMTTPYNSFPDSGLQNKHSTCPVHAINVSHNSHESPCRYTRGAARKNWRTGIDRNASFLIARGFVPQDRPDIALKSYIRDVSLRVKRIAASYCVPAIAHCALRYKRSTPDRDGNTTLTGGKWYGQIRLNLKSRLIRRFLTRARFSADIPRAREFAAFL